MKNQILTLVIGILIGACIATGVFLVLKDNDKKTIPSMDGKMPQMSEDGSGMKRSRPSKDGSKTKDSSNSNSTSNSNSSSKSEN